MQDKIIQEMRRLLLIIREKDNFPVCRGCQRARLVPNEPRLDTYTGEYDVVMECPNCGYWAPYPLLKLRELAEEEIQPL